jgi:UDP-2-acetamido-2,6-beta-L-arabino-hexul-4-ose reductase
VIEYPVDGEQPKVLDIPTGYTHNITNTGDDILITLFWSTEIFDPTHPDTHFMEV